MFLGAYCPLEVVVRVETVRPGDVELVSAGGFVVVQLIDKARIALIINKLSLNDFSLIVIINCIDYKFVLLTTTTFKSCPIKI
jgi:hypothetical protein